MRLDLPHSEACSFCADLAGERPCAFVIRSDQAAVEVNERAYEHGAMLVIPRVHRTSIFDVTDAELQAVYQLARQAARAAITAFGACGVNIFQNNGVKAGQTEAHFHVHVVPRYESSDPERRFRSSDYEPLSLKEQHAVAAALRAGLHA